MKPETVCDCSGNVAFFDEEARARARRLSRAGQTARSWDELYRCDCCGQLWDLTFPGVGNLCSVELELSRVSAGDAREKYGESVQESRPITGAASDASEREAERR